jgi:hypothetical protein
MLIKSLIIIVLQNILDPGIPIGTPIALPMPERSDAVIKEINQ